MSALRVGCDLCEIAEIERMLQGGPGEVERLFTAEEQAYAAAQANPAQHFAGIFAAKEALAKALRRPGILGRYHREVTVTHQEDGGPSLRVSEPLRGELARSGVRILDCSVSHDGAYAMATVLVQVDEPSGRPESQQAAVSGSAEQLACHRCLLTLGYLREQRVADVLIPVQRSDGTTAHVCPVCMRGW